MNPYLYTPLYFSGKRAAIDFITSNIALSLYSFLSSSLSFSGKYIGSPNLTVT